MKYFFLSLAIIALASGCKVQHPLPPPPPAEPTLNNALDSFSYALGLSISGFYKEQGVKDINEQLVLKAIKDVEKDSVLLNDDAVNSAIMNYLDQLKAAESAHEKEVGAAFLEENKAKEGVVALPSGLQYKILKQGTGSRPQPNNYVMVHYTGKFLDGTIFDSSIERGEPLRINVGGVIKGWTEALTLMPQGSKWILYIPSDLGYGDYGSGPIKPGATLIFEVELLEIVN